MKSRRTRSRDTIASARTALATMARELARAGDPATCLSDRSMADNEFPQPDHEQCADAGFDWVARELVFSDPAARTALKRAFLRHRNDGSRKLVRSLCDAAPGLAWPSGETYLRTLGWRPASERDANYSYRGDEPMSLLAARLTHVAHRLYRDVQVRAFVDPRSPTHWDQCTHVIINRNHFHEDDERNPCGIRKGSLLSIAAGLRFMREPAHAHPACDCTVDPHPI